MDSLKLSLAINCLLLLSRAPGLSCNSFELDSRRVHTSSELHGAHQPLLEAREFHASLPHALEKRKAKKKKQTSNVKNLAATPQSTNNNNNNNNNQKVLELNPLAIQAASKKDGKEKPGQAPSLTSPVNFINFCISGAGKVGKAVIQNGKQFKTNEVSCNGVPMGMIPAPDKTPSLRFFSPKNMDTVPAKKTFTVSLGVKNLAAGFFTPPLETYFAAPVQLDDKAVVIGHTHIVAQRVESLSSTELLDPRKFAFFKGIDAAQDKDGRLNAEVKDGLEPGVYRFSSMTAAANHQNIAVALAQHDSMDDMIYITVK